MLPALYTMMGPLGSVFGEPEGAWTWSVSEPGFVGRSLLEHGEPGLGAWGILDLERGGAWLRGQVLTRDRCVQILDSFRGGLVEWPRAVLAALYKSTRTGEAWRGSWPIAIREG